MPTEMNDTSSMVENADLQDLREIWLLQRMALHYRIPVWDRLAERLGPGWRLRVFSDLSQPRSVPEDTREYLEHMDQPSIHRLFGWPGMLRLIRREKPALVITESHPRNLTIWRLAREVSRSGGRSIAWVKGHRREDQADSAITDFLRHRTIGSFDAVVVYGENALPELARLGIPRNRIFVAQNTIDTSRIFSNVDELEQAGLALRERHGLIGRKVVLYAGTMFPKKRQIDLVNALPRLRDRYPDVSIVFVGGGENLETIRARAQEMDPERILVIGRVPDGVDYEWLAACDVAVQCGGLGLSINQSLALAKPTVVADEPGVDGELVVDGVTGWRYPRGDIDALADTISSVFDDPESSALIAAAGRDAILGRATIDHMVDGVIDAMAYCGLVEGRKVQ